MELFYFIFLLILSLFFLLKSTDSFIEYASKIALRYRVPEYTIGIFLVGIGTSLPEAIVSFYAALEDNSEVIVGTNLGSNITNVYLIMGVGLLWTNYSFKRKVILYEFFFGIFALVILSSYAYFPKTVSPIIGGVGLITLGYYLLNSVRLNRIPKVETEDIISEKKKDLNKLIFSIILSLLVLFFSGRVLLYAVGGIVNIIEAKYTLNAVYSFISFFVISFCTSLPELITIIVSTLRKKMTLAFGSIFGSNLFNILFNVSLSSFITPIIIKENIPILLSTLSYCWIILFTFIGKRPLRRRTGQFFIFFYCLFLIYLFYNLKK